MTHIASTVNSKILRFNDDDLILCISAELLKRFGYKKALFLQRLHSYMNTDSATVVDGIRWVYNSYPEWSEKLSIPERTIFIKIRELEKAGIILSTVLDQHKSDTTKSYTINYDNLNLFMAGYC